MESFPKRQVEWIDEIVFPEGFEAALRAHSAGSGVGTSEHPSTQAYLALKLHLSGAPKGAKPCNTVQPAVERKPLVYKAQRNVI
jgi:hypothetical protein